MIYNTWQNFFPVSEQSVFDLASEKSFSGSVVDIFSTNLWSVDLESAAG